MQPIPHFINSPLNQIHRWSEPEQNPMTRMFLTRLSEIVCLVIEVSLISFKALEISLLGAKQMTLLVAKTVNEIFPSLKKFKSHSPASSYFSTIQTKGKNIGYLVAGLASTVFIGLIFSPEANFKIHLQLGLATDNLAEKNQRELAAKLQAEMQKAKITKERTERFAKLEAERQAAKKAEREAYAVESRLAELLFPNCS